jgi:hypothetical protein
MSEPLPRRLQSIAEELTVQAGGLSPGDPLFTALSRAARAAREAAVEADSPSVHCRPPRMIQVGVCGRGAAARRIFAETAD